MLRYGLGLVLAGVAVLPTGAALAETPHFIFLGVVVVSALFGGLGPALVTAVLTILLQLLFVNSLSEMLLTGGIERLGSLLLVVLCSLMLGCFVAALRRERNQLMESEERYRVLAESASDGILVMDERGEILFVNPVAERMFGASAPHILGQNMARLVPCSVYQPCPDEPPRVDSAVSFHLPNQKPQDKLMLLEMSLSACTQQGRRLYTAIIRDITGLQRAVLPL